MSAAFIDAFAVIVARTLKGDFSAQIVSEDDAFEMIVEMHPISERLMVTHIDPNGFSDNEVRQLTALALASVEAFIRTE